MWHRALPLRPEALTPAAEQHQGRGASVSKLRPLNVATVSALAAGQPVQGHGTSLDARRSTHPVAGSCTFPLIELSIHQKKKEV